MHGVGREGISPFLLDATCKVLKAFLSFQRGVVGLASQVAHPSSVALALGTFIKFWKIEVDVTAGHNLCKK